MIKNSKYTAVTNLEEKTFEHDNVYNIKRSRPFQKLKNTSPTIIAIMLIAADIIIIEIKINTHTIFIDIVISLLS